MRSRTYVHNRQQFHHPCHAFNMHVAYPTTVRHAVANLMNRRALFTERAWNLQGWLSKPITGQTKRDLQLVPTCPCMLHPAPSVIATQPSHVRWPITQCSHTISSAHKQLPHYSGNRADRTYVHVAPRFLLCMGSPDHA